MSKVQDLIDIVYNAFGAEIDKRNCYREFRKKYGLSPKDTIWVPALSGSDGFRIGELCGRSDRNWRMISDICDLMDIDRRRLISTVKSMQHWERHGGRYDRAICLSDDDEERLMKFISKAPYDANCYRSTGRKKAWCE